MEEQPYERYKVILTKDEFFATWDEDQLRFMNEDVRDVAYAKYLLKCGVFQRDDFTCQNENCQFCNNEPNIDLTLHHIKFQRNGGKNTIRNCITICHSAHKHFHSKKGPLTFWEMTYMEHQSDAINWKIIKANSKQIREANKQYHGYRISWEMLIVLMRFLEVNYDEFE